VTVTLLLQSGAHVDSRCIVSWCTLLQRTDSFREDSLPSICLVTMATLTWSLCLSEEELILNAEDMCVSLSLSL
jgi:hypothetical protein